MMESAGPRESSFGLLTAEVPQCIPEFMTGIPHINESFPSASSITPDHFSAAGCSGQGTEEERGLLPLVELEQQQARHQAPTPVGRSSGQGAGDQQGVRELSSTVQGLHHPSRSGDGDTSPITGPGPSLPAEKLGGKSGAPSPHGPSLSGKHSSNSGVEYAWMKEKKPSRKQQHLEGDPTTNHPSSVMQHQVSALQLHQTTLNGLGKLPYLYGIPEQSLFTQCHFS